MQVPTIQILRFYIIFYTTSILTAISLDFFSREPIRQLGKMSLGKSY